MDALFSFKQKSKIAQIQRAKKLTGSASNLLIFERERVLSLNFRLTVSNVWDPVAIPYERRSKFDKITIRGP